MTREVDDLDELTLYSWRVLAANNTGESPWSETRNLTTVPPLPDLVMPIAPGNNVVGVPPTLDLSWGAVPVTDRYHLQVATAFNFSGIVFNVDTLTTTTQQIGPLEIERKYFWRVRGMNKAGPGPWSAVGTSIEQLGEAIPEHYALHPNYSNPFNPQTTLRFDLPEAAPVSLVIYDLLGRVVETLVEGDLAPGQYRFVWQAADRPSGLYLAHLNAGSFSQTRNLILMK